MINHLTPQKREEPTGAATTPETPPVTGTGIPANMRPGEQRRAMTLSAQYRSRLHGGGGARPVPSALEGRLEQDGAEMIADARLHLGVPESLPGDIDASLPRPLPDLPRPLPDLPQLPLTPLSRRTSVLSSSSSSSSDSLVSSVSSVAPDSSVASESSESSPPPRPTRPTVAPLRSTGFERVAPAPGSPIQLDILGTKLAQMEAAISGLEAREQEPWERTGRPTEHARRLGKGMGMFNNIMSSVTTKILDTSHISRLETELAELDRQIAANGNTPTQAQFAKQAMLNQAITSSVSRLIALMQQMCQMLKTASDNATRLLS